MKRILLSLVGSVLVASVGVAGATTINHKDYKHHECKEEKSIKWDEENKCEHKKDVCKNIEGKQETVPEGYELKDKECVKVEVPPVETPPVVTPPVVQVTPPAIVSGK